MVDKRLLSATCVRCAPRKKCHFTPYHRRLSVDVADMAEAAAIVGLVASIISLVDLSARVVSRLHDFTSKSSDIPESFRSL